MNLVHLPGTSTGTRTSRGNGKWFSMRSSNWFMLSMEWRMTMCPTTGVGDNVFTASAHFRWSSSLASRRGARGVGRGRGARGGGRGRKSSAPATLGGGADEWIAGEGLDGGGLDAG